MALCKTFIILGLLLACAHAAVNNNPPCRYNCPDTEKLICATFDGENRTFFNRCQLELLNCITRTDWQIIKRGACDTQH